MTRVSVVSDLHLEFADCALPGGEILILAGDIWLIRDMTTDGSARPEPRKRFVRFCTEELSKYDRVLVVTGNHESYGANIDHMNDLIRAFLAAHAPRAQLLANEVEMIDGVAFLGTPLWSTCGVGDRRAEGEIAGGMNDFRLIRTSLPRRDDELPFAGERVAGNERRFTPRDANAMHEEAIAWLRDELPKHDRVVVIGHHAPSFMSANGARYGTSRLDPGYCSNQHELIEAHPQIKVWLHGHTHRAERYQVGSTKVIANPRGYYPDEWSAQTFDPTAADFDLGEI